MSSLRMRKTRPRGAKREPSAPARDGQPSREVLDPEREVSDPTSLLAVQRRAGNRAALALVQREDTITFTEAEGSHITRVGAGGSPQLEIQNEVNKAARYVRDYWSNYGDGLQAFTNAMSFASDQEAEAQVLSAAVKSVAKELVSVALDQATENPTLKATIGVVKAGVEGVIAEYERAENAAGQVKIREFINGALTSIDEKRDAMSDEVDGWRTPLFDAYAEEAGSETELTDDGWLMGPGAKFIIDLRDLITQLRTTLRQGSSEHFQQVITERFASMGGSSQLVDLTYEGGWFNGELYLSAEIYRDPGDNSWSLESVDNEWTLASNSPEVDNIATSLKESLQGAPIHESNLKKVVRVEIETEKDWALNVYDEGAIHFTDIDSVQIHSVDPQLHGTDPNSFRTAWDSFLKDRVAGVTGLRGRT